MYKRACSVMFDSLWPVDCSPPGSSVRWIFRQEYYSGLPFPPPDLSNPGIELRSPALAGGFFATEPPGKCHLKNENAPKFPIYPTTISTTWQTFGKPERCMISPLTKQMLPISGQSWKPSHPGLVLLPPSCPQWCHSRQAAFPPWFPGPMSWVIQTHSLDHPVIQQQPLLKSAQVSWHTLSIFGPIQPITASSTIINVFSRKHTSLDDTIHDLRNMYGALIPADG